MESIGGTQSDTINTHDYFISEFNEREQEQLHKSHNAYLQKVIVDSLNKDIKSQKEFLDLCQQRSYELVSKENYTDVDKELVKLYIECIKYIKIDIKNLTAELVDYLKYPVGSELRPGIGVRYGK